MKSEINSLQHQSETSSGLSRNEMDSKIELAHSELKSSYEALHIQIKKFKTDLIKWMFIFYIGTVITIVGSLFGFLKLFLKP